jgi:hypothetical protein
VPLQDLNKDSVIYICSKTVIKSPRIDQTRLKRKHVSFHKSKKQNECFELHLQVSCTGTINAATSR